MRKAYPKILKAWKLGQEAKDQLRQCVYVFTLQTHFVGEHVGKKHDVKCQYVEKKNLIFGIPLPNQFGQLTSFDQTTIQQDSGSHENIETLQTYALKGRSK